MSAGERVVVGVFVVFGVICFAALVSSFKACGESKCAAGLHPEMLQQYRHVYKCVCVGDPQ